MEFRIHRDRVRDETSESGNPVYIPTVTVDDALAEYFDPTSRAH